jgi:short subunit dehydrogenase-like uncharacterized protein
MSEFLLYGAYGYTGQLIIEEAFAQGLKPILAGRQAAKLQALAEQYQLPYLAFALEDQAALEAALKQVKVVLHAAGPFSQTAEPMLQACLKMGVHYLDITGEIAVFERCASLDAAARQAGIMVMPGTGFDVVPTDCMALFLKNQMPDAQNLRLAFGGVGGQISHGTAMTMAQGLGEGGAMRKNGKIVKVPLGHAGMQLDFPQNSLFVMAIPWGDVSTAFYTTGIPNIETFTAVPPSSYKMMRWQSLFNWLLRKEWVRRYVRNRIDQRPAGPDKVRRERAYTLVWGEVKNAKGELIRAWIKTEEAYNLTAEASVNITKKVLNGQVYPGFKTPAGAYGADLVMELRSVSRSNF